LYASPNGFTGLSKHFDTSSWNFKKLSADTKLNIGKRELEFIFTPMVHWPDNMLTYSRYDKILFSNDAFGLHLASSERFDDEYPLTTIMDEAKKYYANIVMPYGEQVKKALAMVGDRPIEVIANSHGILWRKHIPEIIEKYKKWSNNETDKKAVIIYDSMWNSTEKMAEAIEEGFLEKGYKTSLRNLRYNHISDIITEVLEAEYICIGSPTLNNNILPTVAAFLAYLKGLAPKGRKAVIFGSYGWGGQAVKIITEEMEKAKFDVVYSKRIQYIPKKEDLEGLSSDIKNL
jgi:flavorubredoxin